MLLKSTICNEIVCCYNGKICKEDKVVIKNIATWIWKVTKLMLSDEGIPTEGMVQN